MSLPRNSKRGIALALVLTFAILLLTMALAYNKMLQNTQLQTDRIDDRGKLTFIGEGLIQKALLKFQLFPGDFYSAWEAASMTGDFSTYVAPFYLSDPGLTLANFAMASSTFSNVTLNAAISSMSLLTLPNWRREAIRIEARVWFQDKRGHNEEKSIVKIFTTKRETKGL